MLKYVKLFIVKPKSETDHSITKKHRYSKTPLCDHPEKKTTILKSHVIDFFFILSQ